MAILYGDGFYRSIYGHTQIPISRHNTIFAVDKTEKCQLVAYRSLPYL